MGGITIAGEGEHAWIVGKGEPNSSEVTPLLGVERLPNGNISLIAHITGQDGKVIVEIDQNNFWVNRNAILDSLSPPRTDRSTILLRDSYGNVRRIRFANKRFVTFSERIYIREGMYLETSSTGVKLVPGQKIQGPACFELSNPKGAGFLRAD